MSHGQAEGRSPHFSTVQARVRSGYEITYIGHFNVFSHVAKFPENYRRMPKTSEDYLGRYEDISTISHLYF